jgi:DNA excision repair protein ERCC-4
LRNKRPKTPPMVIIRDTREQNGYDFACLSPKPQVKVATLTTGDYSLEGLEDQVTVERKSLADAFGTIGGQRERFIRELERMTAYQYAAVVIEADWPTIYNSPPRFSELHPKSVRGSIIAWNIRHKVMFWTMPDRFWAEKWTFYLLERFWKDYHDAA